MKKEELLKSNTFCIMPWVHLATDPDGSVKVCCLTKGKVTSDEGLEFNLGKDNIKKIYNSKYYKNVRKKMLSKERIDICKTCWIEEDNGGYSRRMTTNEQVFNFDIADKLLSLIEKSQENDYITTEDPIYYDFRFGNLCNLKCRSCGSLNSSQLYKENKELIKDYNLDFFGNNSEFELINDWYNTKTFKTNVYSNIDKIKKIYFTGGEPTLIEENYNLMRTLINKGIAKNIKLTFNTNMTNLKDEFYELIQEFQHVEIAISVEGYGKIQEYLRYPSKWEQVEQNIRRMADMSNNAMFAVPVIQSVNLEYIVDFFDFIQSINREKGFYKIALLPIILDFPKKLSAHILPIKYKQQCMSKIKEYVDRQEWLKNDPHFMGRYNNIETICNLDNYNLECLKEFKHFTNILDNHRKQSLKDINLKLWEIIKDV